MDPQAGIVWSSPMLKIGLFRCPTSYPCFENTGPASHHLVVFPRTSVWITHAGGSPVVANPNVVMFYNRHQEYRRGKISERGDRCEWFSFATATLADVLRRYDPAIDERWDHPFLQSHGPSDAQSYLLQRLVVRHVLEAEAPDQLYVEETMLHVLDRVVSNVQAARAGGPTAASPATQRTHRDLVRDAQQLLTTRYRERLTLGQVADALHTSPYHLSRLFHEHTGRTLHHYLAQLRLRTALEEVPERDGELADLALDLGYSSHSHFTQAFRQTFGLPPSALQRQPSARRLRELSKKLIA